MHDDVHGTAVVTLAAAIAACRQVGCRLDEPVVGQLGLGAAGFGIASLIQRRAASRRVLASDPERGVARSARATAGSRSPTWRRSWREADVVVATTRPARA